jgi:hypothetical protein
MKRSPSFRALISRKSSGHGHRASADEAMRIKNRNVQTTEVFMVTLALLKEWRWGVEF